MRGDVLLLQQPLMAQFQKCPIKVAIAMDMAMDLAGQDKHKPALFF